MFDPSLNPGRTMWAGKECMIDSRGAAVPLELVKTPERLEDEMVRDLFARAIKLEADLREFKRMALQEVDSLLQLLDEKYDAPKGGKKGNVTLDSFDATIQCIVAVADRFSYGAAIQSAKGLVDECVAEWSTGARPELVALVTRAFQTDKQGNFNRAALLSLRSLKIEDPRWLRAMDAIKDAEKVEDTKRYIRFAKRLNGDAPWSGVHLNIASA